MNFKNSQCYIGIYNITSTSGLVGYENLISLKDMFPFRLPGLSPLSDQLSIGEIRSITEYTFAPAPFAMENASIKGEDIPKFIEAIMTLMKT